MRTSNPLRPSLISKILANGVELREFVRQCGTVRVDPSELNAHREAAKAEVHAFALKPFDENIASDHALIEDRETIKGEIKVDVAKCDVYETRLLSTMEQTARLPEPRRSLFGIALSATGLFSLCFAPTIFSVFMSGITDPPLAWLVAIIIAAGIGAFLVQVLLQPRPAEQTPPGAGKKKSHQASLVGFGLGIGFGLLRLAKAGGAEDYLIATALTLLECVAVAGLDWFASNHFQEVSVYLDSQARSVALEHAVARLEPRIEEKRNRYAAVLGEIILRESDGLNVERVAEWAAWTIEAAYRGAVNANARLLEGGGVFPSPRRSNSAIE
jgi:hypothetical protein